MAVIFDRGDHDCTDSYGPDRRGGEPPLAAPPAPYIPGIPDTTPDVDDVLDERGARYGRFIEHAALTQALKREVANHLLRHSKRLADDQQEAVDMILHKIGRIVNGDPDYADSWVDIEGYARLVSRRLVTGECV